MKLIKKIILFILFLISLFGIIAAVDEYAGGYDEILATVNHTWKSQKRRSPRNKYTIIWNDLEGEKHQGGSFANKYGYEEGDEIVIKVDKKTHEQLYAPTTHLIVFIILFVIALSFFIGTIRKEHRDKNQN
ncbi:MAG: hypothetical protein ACI4F4_02705 [Lachnospiraceae bacterium]